jgi:hypothetical protein
MPGQGLLPQQGKLPFLFGAVQSLRHHQTLKDAKLQPEAILPDYVMGFGPKASHIVVPLECTDSNWENEALHDLLQEWDVLLQEPSSSLPSDTKITPHNEGSDATSKGLRIPMMLPIIGPLQLPAGIIGHPSMGIDSIKIISTDGSDDSNKPDCPSSWIENPMVRAWFAAAACFAPEMSIELVSKQSIADSLIDSPSDPSGLVIHLANTLMLDYWRAMEATLFFRYCLDSIIGTKKASKVSSRFYKYLANAASGLYHKNNILGCRPLDVGFEALLLRPPSVPGRKGAPNSLEAGCLFLPVLPK